MEFVVESPPPAVGERASERGGSGGGGGGGGGGGAIAKAVYRRDHLASDATLAPGWRYRRARFHAPYRAGCRRSPLIWPRRTPTVMPPDDRTRSGPEINPAGGCAGIQATGIDAIGRANGPSDSIRSDSPG